MATSVRPSRDGSVHPSNSRLAPVWSRAPTRWHPPRRRPLIRVKPSHTRHDDGIVRLFLFPSLDVPSILFGLQIRYDYGARSLLFLLERPSLVVPFTDLVKPIRKHPRVHRQDCRSGRSCARNPASVPNRRVSTRRRSVLRASNNMSFVSVSYYLPIRKRPSTTTNDSRSITLARVPRPATRARPRVRTHLINR